MISWLPEEVHLWLLTLISEYLPEDLLVLEWKDYAASRLNNSFEFLLSYLLVYCILQIFVVLVAWFMLDSISFAFEVSLATLSRHHFDWVILFGDWLCKYFLVVLCYVFWTFENRLSALLRIIAFILLNFIQKLFRFFACLIFGWRLCLLLFLRSLVFQEVIFIDDLVSYFLILDNQKALLEVNLIFFFLVELRSSLF